MLQDFERSSASYLNYCLRSARDHKGINSDRKCCNVVVCAATLVRTVSLAAPVGGRSTGGFKKRARFQNGHHNEQCCFRCNDMLHRKSQLQYKKNRSRASCTTQAKPFVRFSPVMALHLTIIHLCVVMLSSSSFCRTSSSPIHPGTSVLFKKTRRLAPDNLCTSQLNCLFSVLLPTSSSSSSLSSVMHSLILRRSVASTTHIRASVFSK